MKLNEQIIERIVKEELEKFLESNPQFAKMMRQHAQNDASKAVQADPEAAKKAAKDKQFRQAQKGQGGTRDIEIKEDQFPKTTPPKTSGTSSKLINKAVQTSKEKKKGGDK
jgi:DNA gyrase/topoisomerase IV subunit B